MWKNCIWDVWNYETLSLLPYLGRAEMEIGLPGIFEFKFAGVTELDDDCWNYPPKCSCLNFLPEYPNLFVWNVSWIICMKYWQALCFFIPEFWTCLLDMDIAAWLSYYTWGLRDNCMGLWNVHWKVKKCMRYENLDNLEDDLVKLKWRPPRPRILVEVAKERACYI